MSSFQLLGLEPAKFDPLFDLSDDELAARGMLRRRADSNPGFPCRISLQDAAIGEEVLLLPYAHHDVDSPYRSLGPIYVRKGVAQAVLPPGVIPEYVSRRLISLRAYDGAQLMLAACVLEGAQVADWIELQFANTEVSYIHLHNARPGCFSCLARRVKTA